MEHKRKLSVLGRLNVARKLAIVPTLFILAIAANLLYTVSAFQNQESEAIVQDMLGRQRMLNQQFVREIISSARGFEPEYEYSLGVLEETLESLINGGSAVKTLGKSELVTIPPAATDALRSKLLEQKKILGELKQEALDFLKLTDSDPNFADKRAKLLALTEELHFVANDAVKLFTEHTQGKVAKAIQMEFGVTAVVIILGILFSWKVARGILQPLDGVVGLARKVSAGDLRAERLAITSEDEIGQLGGIFNTMLGSLREIAEQTRAATSNLNSATAEILASTQQQASSTNEQATAVQETTATVEEISQSGAQIAEKSKSVASAAEATTSSSNAGLQAIGDMNQAMAAIREQVEAVAENIVFLSEKTQTVGEIISSVNDIAEQSNLLALNAAIEATAAGEQGKSFTVVANEMKNLADQAKESTLQVRTILEDIQKGITSSVMLTEEAVKRAESGKVKSDVAEETIRQMASNIQESVQVFQQIVGATNQQQIGLEQVTEALKNINQATAQTVTGTNQLEKSATNINVLGQQLQNAVERYQL